MAKKGLKEDRSLPSTCHNDPHDETLQGENQRLDLKMSVLKERFKMVRGTSRSRRRTTTLNNPKMEEWFETNGEPPHKEER